MLRARRTLRAWLAAGLCGLLLEAYPCGAQEPASPSLPSAHPAPTPPADAHGPCSLAALVARHALALNPTRPAWSLEFPLQFVRRVFWDTSYLLTAPGRWDRSDWTGMSLFAAGTAGIMALDREIDVQSRIEHPRGDAERHFENGLQELAALPGIAGIVGTSAAVGLAMGNERLMRMAIGMGEALLIADPLFTRSLKEATGRSRPREEHGTFHFAPFAGSASLPSGHTSAAFAMAASAAEEFDNNLWVAIPAYALATGVGIARIRADAHFASDVFLGAALGVLTARTVVRLEHARLRRTERRDAARWEVTPIVRPDVRGVELTLRF